MDIERIFNYKGENIYIKPGNALSKVELITRLNEMKFPVDASFNKNLLVDIYDSAINADKNKLMIFNKLKKDTECYKSILNLQRKNINNENKINTINTNTKKYFINSYNDNNNNNYYEDKNDEDDQDSSSSSENSSLCRKILKFINNHRIDIIEKLFYLVVIFSFDAFLKNFVKNNYILGKILTPVRNVVTPKRLVLGFLFYWFVKYILNMFFYYLFGFGILTIIYLIFKDKLKDYILNAF